MVTKHRTEVTSSELASIRLFSTLKKPALEHIAKLVEIKKLAAGHQVYGPRDVRDRLIIVRSGSLLISKMVGGEELILSTFGAGDFLGEEIIFHPGGHHHYQIKTYDQPTEIMELSVINFSKLLQQFPDSGQDIQQQIIATLNYRLQRTDEKLAVIYGLGKLMSEELTSDTLEAILKIISHNRRCAKALIASFDPTSRHILVEKSLGYRPVLDNKPYSLTSDTVLSLIYHSRKPLRLEPSTMERQFRSVQYMSETFLAVPLPVGNDVVGALVCAEKLERGVFDHNDEIFLASVGKMIAPAVRALQHQKMARNQAYLRRDFIDSLSRA